MPCRIEPWANSTAATLSYALMIPSAVQPPNRLKARVQPQSFSSAVAPFDELDARWNEEHTDDPITEYTERTSVFPSHTRGRETSFSRKREQASGFPWIPACAGMTPLKFLRAFSIDQPRATHVA